MVSTQNDNDSCNHQHHHHRQQHDSCCNDTMQPSTSSSQQHPQNNVMSDRLFEDNDAKFCRVCLDEDDPNRMISPCLCKGSSKWVHKSCLDLWRINEKDRAFAQCTECHYYYNFIPKNDQWKKKTRFYIFLSRDIFFVTVTLQICIAFLGYITYLLDNNILHSFLIGILDGGTISDQCHHDDDYDISNDKNGKFLWCHHQISVYYLYGLFFFLIALGFVGCIILCQNLEEIDDSSYFITDDNIEMSYQRGTGAALSAKQRRQQHELQRANYYRRQRQRQRQHVPYVGESNINARQCGDSCYYYSLDCCCRGCYYTDPCPYNNSHYYYYGGGPESSCNGELCHCCYCGFCPDYNCCFCDRGTPAHTDCCNNYPTSTDSSDCGNECSVFLLVALFGALIIMAVIGFVIGIFLGIILIQRIVQRHMFRLQKKHLVEEFQVADLSKCDIDDVVNVNAAISSLNDVGGSIRHDNESVLTTSKNLSDKNDIISISNAGPLPHGPNLTTEDAANLKKLGLLLD